MLPYATFLLMALVNAAPNKSNDTIFVRQAPNMTTTVSFEPSNNGKFRDNVHFYFGDGNHSVVQTSRDAPCTPLPSGFSSPLINRRNETFNIAVEKDAPVIYFACAEHCSKGEVGAIFPITDDGKTIEANPAGNWTTYHDNAIGARISFASVPQEGTPLGSGVSAQVIASSGLPSVGAH